MSFKFCWWPQVARQARLGDFWCRSSCAQAVRAVFPWATFGVNLVGCLLMGLLIGWLWRLPPGTSETARLFVGVGLLGGFTTFSAFSLELFQLIERRDVYAAFAYGAGSLVGGLVAFAIGFYIVRAVAS
jgi:CrcB protein